MKRWILSVVLVFLIVPISAEGGQGGKNKNYTIVNPNVKISDEMERHVKVRDGYSAKDKKVVVDFVIPPGLGGTADLANLKAFPKGDAKQRKKVEKKVLEKVRKGEMSVGDAQAQIVYWKAYRKNQ